MEIRIVGVVVHDHEVQNIIEVKRELVMDDGSVIPGNHFFPADTLEWRAAEYGIDPDDTETLLDVVLYEAFLPPPADASQTLFLADTIGHARDYHLDRIMQIRGPAKPGRYANNPAVKEIKRVCPVNPEAIHLKKEYVGKIRSSHRAMASKTRPSDADRERERVEALRKSLTVKGTPSSNRKTGMIKDV